jgi:hypothetical protein
MSENVYETAIVDISKELAGVGYRLSNLKVQYKKVVEDCIKDETVDNARALMDVVIDMVELKETQKELKADLRTNIKQLTDPEK